MATIDYKEKYEQALERARQFSEKPYLEDSAGIVEYIFPELAESEDEMIKKRIIALVNAHGQGMYKDEMLSWLEKQGEQKHNSVLDIEIPFGAKDSELQEASYYIPEGFHAEIEGNRVVIKRGEQKPVIEIKFAEESLGIDSDTYNKIVDECIYGEQKPTDKSEPTDYNSIDPHFAKPVDKAEPKFKIGDNIEPIDTCLGSSRTIYKICDGFYETNQGTLDFEFENYWRLIEQKPAWSEDDNKHCDRILKELREQKQRPVNAPYIELIDSDIDWLEFLKNRVQPKQEWSKEDEEILKELTKFIPYHLTAHSYNQYYNWAISHRPQPHWKPSDEQIKALETTLYSNMSRNDERYSVLSEFVAELKKLKD